MLIDFEKIEATEADKEVLITDMKPCTDIAEGLKDYILPKLVKDCSIQFVSNGNWSMHQLLKIILDQTGPADVYISSYAFSEQPARMIAECKSTGLIRRLNCIIDSRIDVRSAGALQLLMNTADRLKLCATHAKVTVIENADWHYTIIGSANYTTNKRYEAGVIIENATLALRNKMWILFEINHD